MSESSEDLDAFIVLEFKELLLRDRAEGRGHGVRHYLDLFPGYEDAVLAEYLAHDRESASDETTNGSDSVAGSYPATETVGDYVLIEELGRGGQAVVWLAEDRRLGRRVALKLLQRASFDGSSQAFERFRREALLTSKLEDPRICSVYEVGRQDGTPFIAMRFVEGETLSELIRESAGVTELSSVWLPTDQESTRMAQGEAAAKAEEVTRTSPGLRSATPSSRREFDELLRVLEGVARALHVAHESGIVHRDLKPANIMVTSTGDPVLLDFGLASAEEGVGPTLTVSGEVMGTPAYMSPEQISASRSKVDRRTDVYSLGVTLFECLTLRRPFDAPSREGLYRAILTEAAPNPARFNPRIAPELRVVLECALDKEPDRRYATAEAFADDLERVRRLEPIAARPLSPWLKTRRWAQRNPVVATMSIGLFVLLAAVATVFFLKNRELDAKNRQLDTQNFDLTRERNRADSERATAQEALEDVERLSDARVLDDLKARAADDLWPAIPEKVEGIKAWLVEAEELLSRAVIHRTELAELRRCALPYAAEDRRRDWAAELARIKELRAYRTRLDERADRADEDGDDKALERIEADLAAVDSLLTPLLSEVETRRSWAFRERSDEWLHGLLSQLVAEIERFEGDGGALASVRERLFVASTLRKRTIEDHEEAWSDTLKGVTEDERYASLARSGMKPQAGLVPLGRDPETGFLEFLHLTSHEGELPLRGADGLLQRSVETGLIFVLLPGGRFDMGASKDSSQANFDPNMQSTEWPVISVDLEPFFMSKYELTQAQWRRLRGGRAPSYYGVGKMTGDKKITWMHPVESLSWLDCERLAFELDLAMPTEAQWEYAARAGTTTPWFTGMDVQTLKGFANIADEGAVRFYPRGWPFERGFFDGYAAHAPVGTYQPNAFGLHDMHGNVSEWVFDIFDFYGNRARNSAIKPLRERVHRGGSFGDSALFTRSAARARRDAGTRSGVVGFRPARSVRH